MATAAAANESRGELLGWLSELLQTPVARIESLGTGAALCQVVDSIYGDVPLHKVKFGAVHEWEFVHNFKVFQAALAAHHVDKAVPVERLVKLRFQDNLEFLQWMKKFWDEHFPGGAYDAAGRRKATLGGAMAGPIDKAGAVSRPAPRPVSVPRPPARTLPVASPTQDGLVAQIATLQEAVAAERVQSEAMAKERDFYFAKLREIEAATQAVRDAAVLESPLFRAITAILYKTEDAPEAPSAL